MLQLRHLFFSKQLQNHLALNFVLCSLQKLPVMLDVLVSDQIELFFKWIKQHLRIKAFFGMTENAVKTQIWIAVSVYVLVAIVKKRLQFSASLYEILQILSLTMFERMPIDQLLSLQPIVVAEPFSANQLTLFD